MAMVGPAEQGARAKNLAIRPTVCSARRTNRFRDSDRNLDPRVLGLAPQ